LVTIIVPSGRLEALKESEGTELMFGPICVNQFDDFLKRSPSVMKYAM
jgi:hypothetical protein